MHFMPVRWEEKLAFPVPDTWAENNDVPDEVLEIFEKIRSGIDSKRTLDLFILPDPDLNAYAFPGGHIGLTSGLLEHVESEESLAFVMAHEIGHFEHRHMLKRMSRSVVFGLARTILFGYDSSSGLLDRAEGLADLGHSRRQEEQADEFALSCLHRTYGHVGGATYFFEQIEDRGWSLQLLQTHPLPRSRIERLQALIEKSNFLVQPVRPISR